jgi:hypothetical protein
LAITSCKKKENVKTDEVLPKKIQNRAAPLAGQDVGIPEEEIPQENQDLAESIRDVQKLIGKGTELEWAMLRASYWPSSWNSTFAAGSSKSVRELINDHNYESLLGKIAKRDLGGLADDEAKCLSKWFAASLISSNSSEDSLPNAFAVQGETVNPTKGDLILYVLFRDAYSNKSGRSVLDSRQKQQWRKMAESPNPVVRLIAAETYLHVEEDLSAWIEYYSAFKEDGDPYILEKALSALYTSGKVEAVEVLKEFNESEVVKENPRLNQIIVNRIFSLQKNATQEKEF